MTVVLGKYGDGFCRAFFEQLREYREDLKYGEFLERNFIGGESIPRLTDGKDEKKKNFFKNPDKLRENIKKDGKVILVYRGRSGVNWSPSNFSWNAIFLGEYLRDPLYGIDVDELHFFEPNEPRQKQDKSEYEDKKNPGEIARGEPCSVDIIRKLMKNYFDKIVTMCAHDSRGKDGWIVKKCRKGERYRLITDWEKLPPGEQEYLETLFNGEDFIYNVDASHIIEKYIDDVSKRFPGTYVVNPDGTPFINKKRVVNGYKCKDGGHMEKVRHLTGDGQGEITHKNVFELDLRGASVLIPDDRMMTGKTMDGTVVKVIGNGAKHIRCVGFHGELHYLPKLGIDSLAMLQGRRTKSEYGLNKVRVHATNSVDNAAFHPPLDILPLGVEVCNKVFK